MGWTNKQPLDGGQLKKVKWLLGKQHVLHDINFLLAIHSTNSREMTKFHHHQSFFLFFTWRQSYEVFSTRGLRM